MKKAESPAERIVGVLKWFFGYTTIGGVDHVRQNDCKQSRTVWAFLVLIGIGCTLWLLYNSIMGFLANNTITTVSLVNEKSMTYPGITLCNANRINCVNLYNLIKDYEKVLQTSRLSLRLFDIF